jgi:hypothetical protein
MAYDDTPFGGFERITYGSPPVIRRLGESNERSNSRSGFARSILFVAAHPQASLLLLRSK